MNVEELSKLKKLADEGVISQEEFLKQKKILMQEGKNSGILGIIISIVLVIFICKAIVDSTVTYNKTTIADTNKKVEAEVVDETAKKYEGEFPIRISALIQENIIGMPELKCVFGNKTDKEIAAIKVYFEPVDVYGEIVKTVFTTNYFYTDTSISIGKTSSCIWQMLDKEIKGGDLYVYSVYFSDGTEWGDKDASSSEIKKYAYKIKVNY